MDRADLLIREVLKVFGTVRDALAIIGTLYTARKVLGVSWKLYKGLRVYGFSKIGKQNLVRNYGKWAREYWRSCQIQ